MLFAILFCCKGHLNYWVCYHQQLKEEQGCMDIHPSTSDLGAFCVVFHSRKGQAEGRVRGARQMAGGLCGHCWSPPVCRHAARSWRTGEPRGAAHQLAPERRWACNQVSTSAALSPGGRGCGLGAEHNHRAVIFLMRIWWHVTGETLPAFSKRQRDSEEGLLPDSPVKAALS